MQATVDGRGGTAQARVSTTERILGPRTTWSLYLLIPGATFEVGIAFWLIVKGFRPAAIAKGLGPLLPSAVTRWLSSLD